MFVSVLSYWMIYILTPHLLQQKMQSMMNKLKFGFTGKSDALNHLSVKLGQWWYIFFAAVGSALISICASYTGIFDFSKKLKNADVFGDYIFALMLNPWLGIGLGCFAIVYGGKGTYADLDNLNRRNAQLREENEEVGFLKAKLNSIAEDSESLQNQLFDLQVKLVQTWLKGSARQLRLGASERITIYYFIDSHFYLLARYSQNPVFTEIHRQKFSRNHGVISQAWQNKICIDIIDCPLYKKDPEAYAQYMHQRYGYDLDKVDSLTMKSHQYVAISIVDADNHIGVIVFESENNFFKAQKVSQVKRYCTDYQSYMVDFIAGSILYDKSAKTTTQNVDHDFVVRSRQGQDHE